MFQSKRALVTKSATFVFLKTKSGKDEPYINYRAMAKAMQMAGLNFDSLKVEYTRALEELAEYKEDSV